MRITLRWFAAMLAVVSLLVPLPASAQSGLSLLGTQSNTDLPRGGATAGSAAGVASTAAEGGGNEPIHQEVMPPMPPEEGFLFYLSELPSKVGGRPSWALITDAPQTGLVGQAFHQRFHETFDKACNYPIWSVREVANEVQLINRIHVIELMKASFRHSRKMAKQTFLQHIGNSFAKQAGITWGVLKSLWDLFIAAKLLFTHPQRVVVEAWNGLNAWAERFWMDPTGTVLDMPVSAALNIATAHNEFEAGVRLGQTTFNVVLTVASIWSIAGAAPRAALALQGLRFSSFASLGRLLLQSGRVGSVAVGNSGRIFLRYVALRMRRVSPHEAPGEGFFPPSQASFNSVGAHLKTMAGQLKCGLLRVTLGAGFCFAGGTPVSTPAGLKPIETIQAGDTVHAWSETQNRIVEARVKGGTQSLTRRLKVIQVGRDTLEVTGNHPFWSPSRKRWLMADQLQVGDHLGCRGRRAVRIRSIRTVRRPEFVYNFEVEGHHNYLVGAQRLLAHNDPLPRLPSMEVGKVDFKSYKIVHYYDSLEGVLNGAKPMPGEQIEHLSGKEIHFHVKDTKIEITSSGKVSNWKGSESDLKQFKKNLEPLLKRLQEAHKAIHTWAVARNCL